MADNLAYTPGAGSIIKTDQDSGDSSHMQVVKLAYSADGVGTTIPADANGLKVNVSAVAGSVTVAQGTATNLKVDASGVAVPVTDNAGSLTVDAPVGTPAFVRLSDGAAAITALPVTDNGGLLSIDDGAGSITVDGTVAATQSGTWNVATLTTITNVVHVDDNATTISVDDGAGSLTVDGTVTANQGTAAAVGSGWPVKVTDGTDTVGISTVGGAKLLKVDVVQTVAAGAQTDRSTFTEATSKVDVIGGVFNDVIAANPTENQAGAVRITPYCALHVQLRNVGGTETGIAATPLRVDPTGSTAQPVTDNGGSLTVDMLTTTNAGAAVKTADYDTGAGTDTVTLFGIALPKAGGAVGGGTATDPIRVDPTGTTTQPVSGTVTANQGTANATPWNVNSTQLLGVAVVAAAAGIPKVGLTDEAGVAFSSTNPLPVKVTPPDETKWKKSVALTASLTDQALFTPTGGKAFRVVSLMITVLTSGALTVFDNATATTSMLYQGTPPVGACIVFTPALPWASAAINNVLRWTTGAGMTGDLVAYGYEE